MDVQAVRFQETGTQWVLKGHSNGQVAMISGVLTHSSVNTASVIRYYFPNRHFHCAVRIAATRTQVLIPAGAPRDTHALPLWLHLHIHTALGPEPLRFRWPPAAQEAEVIPWLSGAMSPLRRGLNRIQWTKRYNMSFVQLRCFLLLKSSNSNMLQDLEHRALLCHGNFAEQCDADSMAFFRRRIHWRLR